MHAPVDADVLKMFDVSTYGFLFCKVSAKLGLFGPRKYTMYWLNLNDDCLQFYADETQTDLKHEIRLNDSMRVKVEAVEISAMGSKLIFSLSDNGTVLCLFNSFDSAEVENWMLALIEKIRGPFRDDENFDKGESDPLIERRSTSIATTAIGDINCSGFLMHFRPGSIFSPWELCFLQLNESSIQFWYSASPTATTEKKVAGTISLQGHTRVRRVPCKDPAQHIFFVAVRTALGTYNSYRFMSKDFDEVDNWMQIVEHVVTRNQVRESSRLTHHNSAESHPSSSTSSLFSSSSAYSGIRPPAAPVLYSRDGTMAGKIMQLLVGDNIDNASLRQFYLEYFCVPVIHGFRVETEPANGTEDTVCVIIFENQRYLPLKGFSSLNLIVGVDPAKLSNAAGVKFPDRYLRRTPPPEGYEWIESSFRVDNAYTDTGKGGWTYASSFPRFETHLYERRSKTDMSDRRAYVRRRRWVRSARCCYGSIDVSVSAHGEGVGDLASAEMAYLDDVQTT
jgi:hypothetical protein